MSISSVQQDASRQAGPLLPCDLVMAGGLTSGIVYPPLSFGVVLSMLLGLILCALLPLAIQHHYVTNTAL